MDHIELTARLKDKKKPDSGDIAIIGIACRLPGANDYLTYWENLKNSVNSISEIPANRWDIRQYYSEDPLKPDTSVSKWAGLLDDIASFDNQFFHISPREAQNMDPQQRLLLEEAWHCIEDAGITPRHLQEHTTSVYVGVMAIDYQQRLAESNEPTDSYACLGNYEGILANRVSFYLGLSGESKSIDTACSSSLVALHDAKRSLNIGESEYAFAAGVSIICHPWKYISFSKSRMLSPDGQCKTFDKDANGYVPGEGVGVLLLTSLENALKNGHRIHGILKGTAVNHTGKSLSITAPRMEAQRDVIKAAQKAAHVNPGDITYIEAHGTGTSLGDPIEVEGLLQAFQSEKTQYCALGSVKTNIGHLEAAAGVAGVIKVLMMLKHRELVPTLNVRTINPIIDLEHSPFYLSTKTEPWQALENQNRMAGVSSFGFGGANAHVIVEEYPEELSQSQPLMDNQPYPFVLSAKTQDALQELIEQWKTYVESEAFYHARLADIAYTQVHGRESFPWRFSSLLQGKDDLPVRLMDAIHLDQGADEKTPVGAFILDAYESISISQWKSLCEHYFAFDVISGQFYRALHELKLNDFSKQLEKGKIKPKYEDGFQLLVMYVFGRWLLENGVSPDVMAGIGVGSLAAAVLTGLMDLKSAIKIAFNKEKSFAIHYHAPQQAFAAPFLGARIEPFSISADYFLYLRQGLDVDAEALDLLLNKSRLLIKNQFTFKQYVEEYVPALNTVGVPLWEIVHDAKEPPREKPLQIALLMVLAVSHKKLSEKWNLSEKISVKNASLSEVMDLILDQALPIEMALQLVDPKTPITYLTAISQQLIASRVRLNKSKPYSILRQQTKLFSSLRLADWQQEVSDKAKNTKRNSEFSKSILHSSWLNIQMSQESLSTVVDLQRFVLGLWQQGVLPELNQALMPLSGRVQTFPTYPFLKRHFMISPLILDDKLIKGDEFYVADHVIQGRKIFPAAAYLEMAYAAGLARQKDKSRCVLKNILWAQPLIVGQDTRQISLRFGELENQTAFEIYDVNALSHPSVYVQGIIEHHENISLPATEKIEVLRGYFKDIPNEDHFYETLRQQEYQYGPCFQTVEWIKIHDNKAFAKIVLPLALPLEKKPPEFYLHPSLLDAGFQVVVGVLLKQKAQATFFPFALELMNVYQPLTANAYVYVEMDSSNQKCSIQFFDESGVVLVDIRGCAFRAGRQPATLKAVEKKPIPLARVPQKLDSPSLYDKTLDHIRKLMSGVLKSESNEIQANVDFEHYGIDSILILELNRVLEDSFGPLSKTLFFEYRNLGELTHYFVTEQAPILEALFKTKSPSLVVSEPLTEEAPVFLSSETDSITDIAIIGLSGKYPQAQDLNQFWENLKAGRDCVVEVPESRWDHRLYDMPKWGSFLDDYDKFDPLFFNISPKEAEMLDPQERLFLETAWGAVEDAGYTPAALDRRVGVFVGVMYGQYQLHGVPHQLSGNDITPESLYASIANRVSYHCNFNGPSMAVDTMCSSSFTALHLACDSLRKGECRLALAGGVNIASHPNKYQFLTRSHFLSSDGKCRSFGEGGDGYVPGEGVGVVLLKPLAEALKDKDHIYAVIKATSLNHGGKTHGYTVPNPIAQAALISETLKKAHINPRKMSYIESHGTGTSLGDPIEIRGLSKAFSEYTQEKQFCSIGSVKSNIGHLESAAGMAALTKVLLQLKYNTLVPSIHSEHVNPNINFKDTPFYVQQKLEPWPSSPHPRFVGISSFGAGGSNAHVIVEEAPVFSHSLSPERFCYLVAISAKSEFSFHQKLVDLSTYLNGGSEDSERLADISYTLNAGRVHFNYRGIFLARSKKGLKYTLSEVLAGRESKDYWFSETRAKEANENDLLQPTFTPENHEAYESQLRALAAEYIQGAAIDWEYLYQNESTRRLALPTYPFLRERYWISVPEVSPKSVQNSIAELHPFLTSNVSTLEEQRFIKTFKSDEFYLNDHVIGGKKILPGVAYLEMARVAGVLSNSQRAVAGLKNILWIKPVTFENTPFSIELAIHPEADKTAFEVRSIRDEDAVDIHVQGELIYDEERMPEEAVNIAALENRLPHEMMKSDFYEKLSYLGLQYGPTFQSILQLKHSDSEILAKLSLPKSDSRDFNSTDFYWHPSLLDGALQATMAFFLSSKNQNEKARVPFALEKIIPLRAIPSVAYAYVQREVDSDRYSIRILDESGGLLVLLKGLLLRAIKETSAQVKVEPPSIHYYQPQWLKKSLGNKGISLISPLVIFEEDSDRFSTLSQSLHALAPESLVIRVQIGQSYQALSKTRFVINPEDPADFDRLLLDFSNANTPPRYFINAWNFEAYEAKGSIENYVAKGVGTLFLLTQALMRARSKGEFVLLHVFEETSLDHALQKMATGFVKSLNLENPRYYGKVIGLDKNSGISAILEEFTEDLSSTSIRYINGTRFVESIGPVKLNEDTNSTFRKNGVYLITGGMGGVGFIIAKYLAQHYQARLILSGRGKVDDQKEEQLEELKILGSQAIYVMSDISNYENAKHLVEIAKSQFKALNGILHCAGVLRDSYIFRKKLDDFYAVMKPKVFGTLNLHKASAKEDLDLFILFSSSSSAFGNIGQVDYATANAFMDAFAASRNKTLSINWPLWEEGGMHVGGAAKEYLKNTFGMEVLTTRNALVSLEKMVSSGLNQIGLIEGDDRMWRNQIAEPVASIKSPDVIKKLDNASEQVHEYLKEQISTILKIQIEKIKPDSQFDEFGIDSIMVLELNRSLEKTFGSLPKTLFFEYRNLVELSEYFVSHHPEKIQALFSTTSIVSSTTATPLTIAAPAPRFRSSAPENEDIAIIGLSGRYPDADNLEQFWENLKAGKDSIISVPNERWESKPYAKWGGFINDYDKFDPLFFNISPKEAEIMDPQERLFLQTAWLALEDAGYSPEVDEVRELGVFVGVMFGHYQMYGAEETLKGQPIATSSSYASIANRASFYLNSTGPSVAIDTMCSSSLSAIHFACQSLLQGECKMALAGGVNIATHPNKYLLLSEGKFLSSDGKCRSFGEGGDGYVPGEGVGAVLLKPLKQAIADRDAIYGVIKGSAINHGGKTNGYTVPNPNAQSAAIQRALKKAKINPRDLRYIESHGTGTSLGDPIEIRGLTKAFSDYTEDRQFCSIGSVKSNIGHLESAAGIVALTKVLLQLKYKTLVPSLHSKVINPNIDFSETPFYVQQSLEEWAGPFPRRAGISSFGAGGANAHLIIEEAPVHIPQNTIEKPCYLITLSANDESVLNQKIIELQDYLKNTDSQKVHLSHISYTLNLGRAHYNFRCAWVLDANARELDSEIHYRSVVSHQSFEDAAIYEKVLQDVVRDLQDPRIEDAKFYKNNLKILANLYTKGYSIDFKLLHGNENNYRVHLPTYPFLKERYWVPTLERKNSQAKLSALHPFIDENVSSFDCQEFEKTLNKNDFYLKDHKIKGEILLPGTAFLEIAQAAGTLAAREPVQHMSDIFWMRPLVMEREQHKLNIRLKPTQDGASFEIYSRNLEESIVHAKGLMDYRLEKSPDLLDIESIRSRCEFLGETSWIYERYRALGYEYGESFQRTSELWCNQTEALAHIQLSETDTLHYQDYILHPTLMDAALRTILGIGAKLREDFELVIPFYLEGLSIYSKIPQNAWVYATQNTVPDAPSDVYYDLIICDREGAVCVSLSKFNARAMAEEKPSLSRIHAYQPLWQEEKWVLSSSLTMPSLLLLIDGTDIPIPDLKTTIFRVVLSNEYQKFDDYHYHVRGNEPLDFIKLWKEVSRLSDAPEQILQISHSSLLRDATPLDVAEWKLLESRTLYPLLFLFQAIEKSRPHRAIKYTYAFQQNEAVGALLSEALFSFSSAIKIINPNFVLKTVEFSAETELNPEWISRELSVSTVQRVRYDGATRYIQKWDSVKLPPLASSPSPLKKNGMYLITGGLGGLGSIFAEFLARHYQAKLVLSGRSTLDVVSEGKIEKLKQYGAEIIYVQADVCDPNSVHTLLQTIEAKWGHLDGILHSAGVASDVPLLLATPSDFEAGMAAKMLGTYFLDYFTREIKLDFFVTFSSISSFLGDYGVGSYAYANAFMNSYMSWRKRLHEQNKRFGVSLSILWPYWESGGMELSTHQLSIYRDYLGLDLLSPKEGLDYFCRALVFNEPNLSILSGDEDKIEKLFGIKSTSISSTIVNTKDSSAVIDYLKSILSEVSKLPPLRIDPNVDLQHYGVDSVMIINFNERLSQDFPDIRKTLLFEHKTLTSLAQYLEDNHAQHIHKLFNKPVPEKMAPLKIEPIKQKPIQPEFHPKKMKMAPESTGSIAIIGLSGRYPEANDIEAFWENLKSGKDCITEIPEERWDYRNYYQPEKGAPGKTRSKWGGFIQDADKFDPLYFNISAQEAELMDPQERLMLETGLKVIEDAGYSVELLHQKTRGSVGVFVGLMWNEYQLLNTASSENSREMIYGSSNNSSISNRLSYAFDFNGPSLVIDTACSSSLIAIQLACDNIRSGACEYAIAGGVNLSLHPSKYVNMSAMGFLASDGRCRSFGEGGDGYVPGEGVGAVLLKPLEKALKDKDFIYGVIIGGAVNHGGKANGFMVPNPDAQHKVILQAIKKSNIDPRTIDYVEAHGTGTALGDPIEITGLTKAFADFTQEKQFCAIGSVKSNVGHLESAAGIVALTKVLLQLKHHQWVPSLHSSRLNPYIDFTQTPFHVQQTLQDWPLGDHPRRAGISSFGASGSNAHIIVEEAPVRDFSVGAKKPCYLITLSAKNENTLRQKISDLQRWVERNPNSADLADISFTLNTGRSHFNYRAAIVVDSVSEIKEVSHYLKGTISNDKSHDAAIYRKIFAGIMEELKLGHYQDGAAYRENLEALANFYVKGYAIDWDLLHEGESKRRIPLPTYPFLRNRYWIKKNEIVYERPRVVSVQSEKILPLPVPTIEMPKLSAALAASVEPDYYAQEWQPWKLELKPGSLVAREHWLLFANKKSIGAELASILSMRKCEVTLVYVGDEYRKLQQHYQINPLSLADMERVFDDIQGPIHGVIHAWSDNINSINSVEEMELAQELICASSLHVSQILVRLKSNAKLYFILNGVHDISQAPINFSIKSVAQATLLGFAKTLLIEQPALHSYVVDLDPESEIAMAADHVLQVINSTNEESIYVFRKGQCFVPRIMQTQLAPLKSELKWHSNKSYLITGGLGGLGFAAARWLVKQGVRYLILTGRREPSVPMSEEISSFREQGIYIEVLSMDIADAQSVEKLCELNHMPAIVGIFHAAGVQEREALTNMSWEHFRRVFQAKVQGTWNLQQLIARQQLELDFIVLYSSIAALFGANRDAPYAAGNAFLDAWASYQRQQGIPAVSINWGPWGDVGMAAVGLELPGLISVPKGLEILGRILSEKSRALAVVSTEYLQFMFQFMPKSRVKWLPQLPTAGDSILSEKKEIGLDIESLVELIKGVLYKILPIDSSTIFTDKSDFFDLGLDSIRALELSRQLQKELGIKLSDAIIFDYSNLGSLSEYLAQQLALLKPSKTLPKEASYRLFCFPYAAGTRRVFSGWADLLPPEVEIYPVDYTKNAAEDYPNDLKTAREIAQELVGILPFDKPFMFLGSCLGSLIAWELAQILQAKGKPGPLHLFVAACAAPHLYPIAMKDTIDLIDRYREKNHWPKLGRDITVGPWYARVKQELNDLGPVSFIDSLQAVGFRDLNLLQENRAIFDLFFPRAVVDMSVAISFRSSDPDILRPLSCSITAFEGQTDPLIRKDFMSSWGLYTKANFNLISLSGDHYFIHDFKSELISQIQKALDAFRNTSEAHRHPVNSSGAPA